MQALSFAELKSFLDEKAEQFNTLDFIDNDPISLPHRFTNKEDIEIAAFLAATIAWGNRKSIIRSGNQILSLMDDEPWEFVINHRPSDLKPLERFVHRTFNGQDLVFFIQSLQHLYTHYQGLESVFFEGVQSTGTTQAAISFFKNKFFELKHPARTVKHISDPMRGSAAKRINMFLRWMVRKDNQGVDFGIWKSIQPSQLSIPLDVHTGNTARKLGLLLRKQNDHKTVVELDTALRAMNPVDPVKYDFALFGLGAIEKF